MGNIDIHPERERSMLLELERIARTHVDGPDGLLCLLPVDPDTYPAQRAYRIEGDPQPVEVIESVATIAEPKFPDLQQKLDDAEASTGAVEGIGKLLNDGHNVILATNHGSLIDIALAEAAVYSMLVKQGYAPRTGIIISRVVSLIGARLGEVMPTSDALKLLCNDIYLSFPRTRPIMDSSLGSDHAEDVARHNDAMNDAVRDNLNRGGVLLGIAASGSVDRQDDRGNVHMETISKGTSRLMMHERTIVMPMAIWTQGSVVFELSDSPKVLEDEEATHLAMERVAVSLTNAVDDKSFTYSRQRISVGSATEK